METSLDTEEEFKCKNDYNKMGTIYCKIQRLYRSYCMFRAVQNIIRTQAAARHLRESKEKELLTSNRKQKIFKNRLDSLMKHTTNKAANAIQSKFKSNLIEKEKEKEKAKRDKKESDLREEEALLEMRKLELKKLSQRSKNAMKAVKKYCSEQISRSSKTEDEETVTSLAILKYHRFSVKDISELTTTTDESSTEEIDQNKIISSNNEKYEDIPWHNNEVSIIMEKYGLEINDCQKMHDIFKNLDYNNSNKVRIIDFFDNMQELKTIYSMWIFQTANTSSITSLKFFEYVHVVSMISLFGKYEIYQLLFSSTTTSSNARENNTSPEESSADETHIGCMNIKQFENWMKVMCEHETVPHSKKAVIKLFDKHSKADPTTASDSSTTDFKYRDYLQKKNLFFDGFVKVQ